MSRVHQRAITLFVVVWLLVFFYESFRGQYLNPLLGRELPKVRFLFPPAGWIMFFQVGEPTGRAEVYGITDGVPVLIDPHDIFVTRAVLYDNIRRNVLISVLYQQRAPAFCRFLHWKFPQYDRFAVAYVQYPSVVHQPGVAESTALYQCTP